MSAPVSPLESNERNSPWLLIVATACAVLVTAGVRAWFHFSTPLVAGLNGAYYLIQDRSLWETGSLAISDFPLTFWLQVGLAKLLHAVAGLPTDDAVMLAVKLADSLLPALLPVPLALLGWQWQCRGRAGMFAAAVPAAIVALCVPVLAITGTFQKHSLALVLFASLVCSLHWFFAAPALRRGIWPVMFGALLALTHVGVFGGALLFSVVLFAVAGFVSGKGRRSVALLALGFFAGTGAAVGVSYHYDAGRVTRLALAIVDPDTFTKRDYHASKPDLGLAPNTLASTRSIAVNTYRTGLGTFDRMKLEAPHWGLLALALATTTVVVFRRKSLPRQDLAIVAAAIIATAVLGAPFYRVEQISRLLPIAVVPGALCLAFMLGQIRAGWLRVAAGSITLGGCLWPTINFIPRGALPAIPIETAAELRQLATKVAPGKQTLVVARRGLEWWTAWILRTSVALPTAHGPADFQKYERVLFLVERPQRRVVIRSATVPTSPLPSPPIVRDGFAAPSVVQPNFPYDATILHSGPNLQLAIIEQKRR